MKMNVAAIYAVFSVLLGPMLAFASPVNAETVTGQTVLASYQATGLCVESDRSTHQLHLAKCVRKAAQDFHMERFDDIARQVSWQKIMNGKDCLQAGYLSGRANLNVERCSISSWSKSAFWSIRASGDIYSQDEYCPYRKDMSTAIGTALVAEKCRGLDSAEFYPAVLTRSAKVGARTLAAYTSGQQIKAIVIENGFSGGNLVAPEGAFLKIDKNGNVSATNGGDIIAGGAGYLIEGVVAKLPGAPILRSPAYFSERASDYAPKSLEFFKKEKNLGSMPYNPR